jgi:hypothetical protein
MSDKKGVIPFHFFDATYYRGEGGSGRVGEGGSGRVGEKFLKLLAR